MPVWFTHSYVKRGDPGPAQSRPENASYGEPYLCPAPAGRRTGVPLLPEIG
jgi:hypothetical protein